MTAGRALWPLIGLIGALAGAPQASGQAQPAVTVGIPGCADDIAVRASRDLITFESRGRAVRAYLYTPRGAPNGDGLVMLHGGTGFEMNSILFDAHAIQLASRGYWVILPAYFDAAAPDATRRTVTGRAWRQAALDAAGELARRGGLSPDRVALWGYSRGAGVAVNTATFEGGGVRSAIIVAGGGSIDDAAPRPDLSVLMLHARRDESVPVRSTLDLAGDLRGAGVAVEVRELPFDGHQYDLPTWCTVFEQTRTFLEGRRGTGDGPA